MVRAVRDNLDVGAGPHLDLDHLDLDHLDHFDLDQHLGSALDLHHPGVHNLDHLAPDAPVELQPPVGSRQRMAVPAR
jgi:hypothetical protein